MASLEKISNYYGSLSLSNEYKRAYHGIADLLEYCNLDPLEIANGEIKDIKTGKVYASKSKLDSNDLLEVALEAKRVDYVEGYVKWLVAALKKAKLEKKDSKFIRQIR